MPEVSTAQGRYFILDNGPVADPARCGICGYGGRDRKYLDPQLEFEFYGLLIFCEECISSMARLFGYIEPAQAQALEVRVEEAGRELIQLRAATAAMEAFRVAIGLSPDHGTTSDEPSSRPVADSVIAEPVESGSPTAINGAVESRQIAESVSVEGRDDLRDFNSDSDHGLSL